ncbi:hypothetical protein [Cryptosporangium phraense]|uniref:Glycosyltransferase RgtA/B/C/D-like domain-containing protein n=1 Tax=Cryptosporangium phraense TaxID=2593070 RepID=A0A545AGD9_9ACTN|nr:hypothetical protein [Cryptosporangium phraense]TQS40371.1 hypothetical protein FL583_35150 [Cryptosporangium phraense]
MRVAAERGVRGSPLAVGLAIFALVGAARSGWFTEGDTFWQVQTGTEIRHRHTVFLPDTFSWSLAGRTWHPNSWLFDVLLSVAYTSAGPIGLALCTLCCVAVVGVGVGLPARALGVRPEVLAVSTTLLVLPLVLWLSARPQTLTYALLPIVVLLAARLMEWSGRRFLVGLAGLYLLVVLWMNLHLAALAAVPAVAAGLGALMLAQRRARPRAAVITTVVLLGCLSSPFGTDALSSALATRDASAALIPEWAPLWRANGLTLFTWLGAALAVALTAAGWRRRPREPLLAVWTGATGILLLASVDSIRFAPMALILAVPAVASWASGVDWRAGPRRRRVAFLSSGTAAGFAATLLVVSLVRLPDLGRPTPASYPTDATVQAIPDGCRVLNEYDDGGYLILRRSEDGVRVALDGRNDVYGAELITHQQGLIQGRPGALAELARHEVHCLLLMPHRPLVAQAKAEGWRVRASDRNRVLLLDVRS